MARHRSFSSGFKRELAKEFLDGRAGLHELARRHSLSRNLIRLWVRKYEAGEFTYELAEAVYIAQYERKIAELERKVGQLTMESRSAQKRGAVGTPARAAIENRQPPHCAARGCSTPPPRPGERARAFKAVSPGMLPPLGILFGLFVAFTVVQVWNDNDRAKEAVDREASALRAVVILAPVFPESRKYACTL
jgi:transposase-like protein